ncbi:glycoside hydrolase family 13 protein [Amphibacillus sp. Q70]|uniref:glycoside hydrolase family 13 protein n=1 Tax=Amphibacillus sp. Q70 TaxID=3453416 RepID=UPI003F8337C9
MTDIYYNSWLADYKDPFGAVPSGEVASFSIEVKAHQILEVDLVIRKEDGQHNEERYPMLAKGNDRFSYTHSIDEGKGLYFYYFSIKWKEANGREVIRFLGSSGFKGEGQLYAHWHEVVPYQLTCYELEEKPPSWYREAVFYQIFPDRFFNGNSNQEINAPKRNTFIYSDTRDTPMYIRGQSGEILRWDFYGGNIAGIRKKIPYLKELGVNALYLNPIFKAASNHRYDTGDYLEIDPVLGDEAQFKQLIEDLHSAGMHVILDGVFSHVGRNSRYFNYDGSFGDEEGAYQNPNSPYYSWFTFENYPNQYKSWWGIDDLPEVDKMNKMFQDFVYRSEDSVIDKWTKLGVDGWRLDVADELPDCFIAGIRQKLDHYYDQVLIGEVWEDASNKISYDQRRQYILGNHLHGVMNYPLRKAILQLLCLEKSPEEICVQLTQLQENYPKEVLYNSLNNIGTHDTERIYTLLGENQQKVKLAFSLLLIAPGVPCLYYGDEAGVTGGKDPENRKFFPWHKIDQNIFNHCQTWVAERKQNETLKHGEWTMFYTNELIGMIRYTDRNYTLLLVNPYEQAKNCHPEQIHFLRSNPLPDNIFKQIFSGLTVAGLGDYFMKGTL